MNFRMHVQTPVSLIAVLALALCALPIAGSVYAQDQEEAEDESAIEEIVVTSRYRVEKLQETPIAITALTDADLAARAFTDTYEVAYLVPNASFRPAQAAYGNAMTAYIRGIGQYDFDFAFEPGVGIYVDDVYQPFLLGTQLDLLNVNRVEVLRGPQGTLFGRGSIGGVVRLISDVPEGDNSGQIDVRFGDYDRMEFRGFYDFALADNVFASIAAAARQRDGYQDVVDFPCRFPGQAGTLPVRDPSRGKDCVLGTQGGEENAAVRGQLRWVASEDVELRLAADYYEDKSEPRADTLIEIVYPQDLSGNTIPTSGYWLFNTEYLQHVPTPTANWGYAVPYDERWIPPDLYETYATYGDLATGVSFPPEAGMERTSVSGTLNWNIGDNLSLTTVLAYTDISSDLVSDADASPLNLQVTGGRQEIDWTQAEVRLNGRAMDNALDWTLGLFYYTGDTANRQAVSFPPILWGIFRNALGLPAFVAASIIDATPFSVNAQNLADVESKAAFGHVVYSFSDRWSVNAGIRYSEDDKDVDFDNTFVRTQFSVPFDHTDWRLGVDYAVSDELMMYGSIATAYRPPAYNPRPFTPAQAAPVGNEEATAYELGMKSDWLGNRLRANLALFYTDYNKRIVPIGGTECVGPPANPSDPGAIIDSAGNVCFAVTSLTSYQQLKDGEVQGVELELAWRPVDALMISGIFGYTNWSSPEVDDCDLNQDGAPDPGFVCTDLPNFVPETNWSVAAAYDFMLGNGSRLTPRVDVYGQDEVCSAFASARSCVDSYELVNVRLEWASQDADWIIAAGVTNLTDEEYLLNKFDLTFFGQNTVEGQPGRPQEWYVEFTRNFGGSESRQSAPPAPPPAAAPAPPPPPANPDLDGDGVLNERDKCPNTRLGAVVDLDGCEVEAVISLEGVHFDFDQATLRPEAIVILDKAAGLLATQEKVVVEVAGHTDSVGSEAYNQGLSERRAIAVKDYLESKGITATRLTALGYGEAQPVATNDTEAGRALNRRVELIVLSR